MQAQELFDKRYITAPEIMGQLGVSRAAMQYARRIGKLPSPIQVAGNLVFVWEREQIKPYLDAWKQELLNRRGHQHAE